ncbi:MAG: DUF5658 family protein [Candidatus Dormibacteraeota bacterium]|nr:DUF5658 family protein [Candidatus Dormibacteraeota bacterium]MDQ6918605.1 DUF5658 family protein [Candidatus Dormibacteraeota bacterium]
MLGAYVSTRTVPRRLLWTWLALVALSQLADLATTWRSLAVGLREGNPVVVAALTNGNFQLFAVVKTALVVALGIVLLSGRAVALAGARLVVLTFSLIAIGNLITVLAN